MDRENRKFLKKLSICIVVLFVIVTSVNLCVMNFTPINRLLGGYEEQKLDLSRADGANITYNDDGTITLGEGYAELEFTGIDARVGSIGFDIDFGDSKKGGKVCADFADATSSYYRKNLTRLTIGKNFDNVMVCNFSGDVSRLRFEISLDDYQSATLKGITLNQSISPMHIAEIVGLWFLVALGLTILIYMIANPVGARKKFSENRVGCARVAAFITAAAMVFTVCLTVTNVMKGWSTTHYSFTSQEGNQISKELVDAFEHHQVNLLEEPSEDLLKLDNPYEYVKRDAEVGSGNFLWDHCFYNGKYYSYYGIGPVLALFLPYHLITGYYFPSGWATLMFSLIGILFLTKIYLAVIEKKFRDLPTNTVTAGLITLQLSSGIMFSAARPLFYELAIASGFMCVAIGAYLLMTSNILWDGKISYVRLGFASFFLGYAVLCRPTLAVYCIAALFFFAGGLKKALDGLEKRQKTRTFFKYAAVALVPLGIIALGQMVYNYLRFDNPLDFGIQYSLTINDFTHAEFHWKYVLINMYAYLFNMPHFTPRKFTYLASSAERFGINGYTFFDDAGKNLVSVGIIYRALPMFAYLFSGKALQRVEKKKRVLPILLIGVTCILMPLAIIFSSWESGYAVRYNADFSWQMVIGALVVAFTLYKSIKSESTKKLVDLIFTFSTVVCVYVNIAQLIAFTSVEPAFWINLWK
ncbi:MAG: hypothetical protein UF217_09835 [Acutalibacteraceae bacterium]|nr:hypothetical protein [Acutalibacteraceae bacterium]